MLSSKCDNDGRPEMTKD